MAGPPFQPIFSGAGSTQMTEHSRKVLLGFEAAGHCDIQYTRLRHTQHLLRTLYSVAQYKLVRRLARRLAKQLGKMTWTQLHRLPISRRVNSSSILACTNSLIVRMRAGPGRPGTSAQTRASLHNHRSQLQQSPARSNPATSAHLGTPQFFRVHRRHQRSQPRVDHLAPVAESSRAAHSVAGGHQGSV